MTTPTRLQVLYDRLSSYNPPSATRRTDLPLHGRRFSFTELEACCKRTLQCRQQPPVPQDHRKSFNRNVVLVSYKSPPHLTTWPPNPTHYLPWALPTSQPNSPNSNPPTPTTNTCSASLPTPPSKNAPFSTLPSPPLSPAPESPKSCTSHPRLHSCQL